MTISTSKLGVMETEEEKVIGFENGILGFENLKRYIIIKDEESMPFFWLQAVDDTAVALPCMSPFEIMPSYTPLIDETVFKDLRVENNNDLLIITTVAVPKDVSKTTTNLAAPIIINTVNKKGVQIVLQDDSYNIRQSVFAEKGDKHHVDTFEKAK